MSIFITAPVDIESGYGRKSREIVAPIAKKYWEETQIAFLKWGQNPKSDLVGTEYEFLLDKRQPIKFNSQPDLHIHVGLPLEFDCRGKTNILFTSGAETNMISYKWIQKINREIDVVVVPSNFIRNVIVNTTFEDKGGKELALNKPVKVIPESYSNDLFSPMSDKEEQELNGILDVIDEKEWFVTYGQISFKKEIGEERKNISTLIQEFLHTFRGNKGVALVIKGSGVGFSNIRYFDVEQYIKRIVNEISGGDDTYPSVYLLEGYLSDPQLFHLMNHDNVISHVTTTHGEGFGRFLLEASLTAKPIIIPKVGAYRDFLYGKSIEYMNVKWVEVPNSSLFKDVIIGGSKWVHMKDGEIQRALKKVYKRHKNMDGTKLAKENKKLYHKDQIFEQILGVVDEHYSKEVDIVIPKLPDDE